MWRSIFLSTALVACQATAPWAVTHLKTGDERYDSSRLSYLIRDSVNEVAVEMVCTKGNVKTFLEVHTQSIPPYQGRAKEGLIVLKIGEETIEGVGYRHEGGQRLSMPQQLHEMLVDALAQNLPVTISVSGYTTTLNASQFGDYYAQLHVQPIQQPFKLPFKL